MLTSKVGVDGGSVDNNYGIKGGTGEPGGSLGVKNGVKFPSRLSLLLSSLLSLNFLESLNSFNFPAIAATLALSNDIKDVCKRKKHKVGRSSKQNFLKHLDINYLGKVRVLRHGRTFTR